MKKLSVSRLFIGAAALAFFAAAGQNQAFASGSTVADDGQASNQLVSQQTSAAAATQTGGIIAGSVSAAIAPPPPGGPVVGNPGSVAAAPTLAPSASLFDRYNNTAQGFDSQRQNRAAMLGNRLNQLPAFNSRNMSGAAAQGRNPATGVWLQGAYTAIDNDENNGQFDGDVINIIAGIDHKPRQMNNRMVVGVAVGYETLDIDTSFNNGTFEGDGFTIAPYIGYVLTPNLTIDVAVGGAMLEYDTSRNNGAVLGSFDSTRYFGTANLTGNFYVSNNKVRLSPKVGILGLYEDQDDYIDSTGVAVPSTKIRLGRVNFGGQVGYQAGNGIEPFAGVTGNWDFSKNSPVLLAPGQLAQDDDFGATFALGVNIRRGNVSGTIQGQTTQLQNEIETYSIMGRVRLDF